MPLLYRRMLPDSIRMPPGLGRMPSTSSRHHRRPTRWTYTKIDLRADALQAEPWQDDDLHRYAGQIQTELE